MPTLPYADPGTPDLRSPLRFLGWVGRLQWRTLLAATCFGVLWMVSQALFPAAVQRAIDEGIIAGDNGRLLLWGGVLLLLGAVGAVTGALRHRFSVTNWMAAAFRGMQLVGYKTADTGQALPRTMPTGEVVATVASDAMRVGGLYDVCARFVGAVVSYVVVAVILLAASRPLGLVVLVGVPLLVRHPVADPASAAAPPGRAARGVGPADHPRRRHRRRPARAARHRRRADLPAPLRGAVPAGARAWASGWPGSRRRSTRPRCCCPASSSCSSPGSAPGSPSTGEITPGELVAFYGYSAFLVIPLRTATEIVDRATRAHIGAAQDHPGAAGRARHHGRRRPGDRAGRGDAR